MGRWDIGVYDSDGSLDFFELEVIGKIEREMAYYMSPEKLLNPTSWLGQVLTIIEVILLFEKHQIGSVVFLWEKDLTVFHWKKEILQIWDANWEAKKHHLPYGEYSFRTKNRNTLEILFNRLQELVDGYDDDEPSSLDRLPETNQLPYFSIYNYHDKNGKSHKNISGYTVGVILDHLRNTIIFSLSDELKKVADYYDIEKIWVCIDVINFLCETYQISPNMTVQVIDRWQKKILDIWIHHINDGWLWSLEELYPTIDRIFNKLRSLAIKYPHHEWTGLT